MVSLVFGETLASKQTESFSKLQTSFARLGSLESILTMGAWATLAPSATLGLSMSAFQALVAKAAVRVAASAWPRR